MQKSACASIDKALEAIHGIKAKPHLWFLEESVEKMGERCDFLDITVQKYPPALEDYSEPIGLRFSRQENWEHIDCQLHYVQEGNTIDDH